MTKPANEVLLSVYGKTHEQPSIGNVELIEVDERNSTSLTILSPGDRGDGNENAFSKFENPATDMPCLSVQLDVIACAAPEDHVLVGENVHSL